MKWLIAIAAASALVVVYTFDHRWREQRRWSRRDPFQATIDYYYGGGRRGR